MIPILFESININNKYNELLELPITSQRQAMRSEDIKLYESGSC